MVIVAGLGIGVVVGVVAALLVRRRRVAGVAEARDRRVGEALRRAAAALGASCEEVRSVDGRRSPVPLVRGRGGGCAWALRAVPPEPGADEPGLLVEALHYGAHDSVRLAGPGLGVFDLDTERLRAQVGALVARVERSA